MAIGRAVLQFISTWSRAYTLGASLFWLAGCVCAALVLFAILQGEGPFYQAMQQDVLRHGWPNFTQDELALLGIVDFAKDGRLIGGLDGHITEFTSGAIHWQQSLWPLYLVCFKL